MLTLAKPQKHRRPYQTVALRAQTQHRVMGFYWGRRCRKSTTAGDIYFQELSAEAGRTVIHCSASLLLGRESIGMTLSAIERGEVLATEATALRRVFEANAAAKGLAFKVANSATGPGISRPASTPGISPNSTRRAPSNCASISTAPSIPANSSSRPASTRSAVIAHWWDWMNSATCPRNWRAIW